jgi:PqqD family protein of HPr-rel-A system
MELVEAMHRPQRKAGILALDMGDGVILYNHDSSLVHHLSPSASVIWNLLDGDVTPDALATEISEEYGIDRGEVSKQVADLIQELDALGLIEDARENASPQSPVDGPRG